VFQFDRSNGVYSTPLGGNFQIAFVLSIRVTDFCQL